MQKGCSSWEVSLDCRDNCRHGGVTSPARELLPPAETAICDLCTASVEQHIREEQTWWQQQTFQDLLFRFQDWLTAAELTAACPNSSQVSYACSKKELQKFEVLQRQILEKLLPLEALNRQYHQLVRSSLVRLQLRATIQEVNRRWDDLKIRTAAVYKRLKHFVSQREEFESERETIRVWLMELDLRVTDVEHFSRGTSLEKMIQLQAFQQDVQANAERVDQLLVRGELLIQKSQPEDAEVLEEQLQDLSGFCQEVFRRVFCFRWRLVSIRLVFEDEWLSDHDSDVESDCFTEKSLDVARETDLPQPPHHGPFCQSTPKKAFLHHKQLDPNLGGNLDLEWDPSVDVGGSTSHEEEEEDSYYSTITGLEQGEEPSHRFFQQEHRPLPFKCGCQEDSSSGGAGQNAFPEEWEQLTRPLSDEVTQTCRSEKFRSWGLEGYQHPQNLTLERGACHQIEPMGFDPKQRIESWLGQSCREKMETQRTGTCRLALQPALELRFPVQSQTSEQQAKRLKPQQRLRRKARPVTPVAQPGQIGKRKTLDSRSAEAAVAIEEGSRAPQPSGGSSPAQPPPRPPALLNRMLLSAFGLLLLLFVARASLLALPEPSCLQTNSYTSSFRLVLKYINGPPPT